MVKSKNKQYAECPEIWYYKYNSIFMGIDGKMNYLFL